MASKPHGQESINDHAYRMALMFGMRANKNPYHKFTPKREEWKTGNKHGWQMREREYKKLNRAQIQDDPLWGVD